MRNKLLVSMAALAIGIAAASCEKSPNEEPAAQQSGSTAPDGQQTQSRQAEQRGAENRGTQGEPAEAQQQRSSQTASQPPAGQENQPERGQQATQGDRTSGPSQSSAQSETGPATGLPPAPSPSTAQSGTELAGRQPQPPQQTQAQNQAQVQQSEAQPNQQKNQPGQNQQATGTPSAGPLNLTRDEVVRAQKLLKEKGFDVGDNDGILGPRTRRALIAFQRQQGLEPSGQIDQRTASALGLSNDPAMTSGHSNASPR